MLPQRLSWRIGLPFVAFVLAGSICIIGWMAWMVTLNQREAFEELARTNAQFINHAKLPPSSRMAEQLGGVLRMSVRFRRGQELVPGVLGISPVSETALLQTPADGRCRTAGAFSEIVAVPLDSGYDLVLQRTSSLPLGAILSFRSVAILLGFWLLAITLAWIVARNLVLPLQHLAARLPDIEKPDPIDLPESQRQDEIGDVARAFARTREALQTERAERERAEKLAVLGRMTAALAHEIQNPVAAIKMHAQLWQGEAAGGTAQVIEHEAARIESLVSQWMFLSKPQPPAMSQFDVTALLAEVIGTHDAQLRHAHVTATLESDGPRFITGDARRLRQVFANLLVNAIQAMPAGGRLTIGSRVDGPHVSVTFTDTGRGFSEEALSRFAEFFFSEKEGGMGIGLSVATEIVKAHGGELRVANQEHGACVTVCLPARDITPTSPGSSV